MSNQRCLRGSPESFIANAEFSDLTRRMTKKINKVWYLAPASQDHARIVFDYQTAGQTRRCHRRFLHTLREIFGAETLYPIAPLRTA